MQIDIKTTKKTQAHIDVEKIVCEKEKVLLCACVCTRL